MVLGEGVRGRLLFGGKSEEVMVYPFCLQRVDYEALEHHVKTMETSGAL